MKKLLVLLLALVMGAGLPGMALAEHEGAARSGGTVDESIDSPNITEVTGRVLGLDREQGAMMLQTSLGVLALKGPPEALRDVAIGDVVRVRIAMAEPFEEGLEPGQRPADKL